MNERVTLLLNRIVKFGVLALTVATPLFFWSLTSEYFETPKFLLLTFLTLILLFLWSLKFLFEGRVKLVRTPMDLAFLLILVVAIISTVTSSSHAVSILGNFPRIHGSLISMVVYVLFFFILVSNLRTVSDVKQIFTAAIISGVVLAVITLLSYFGVFLPFAWAKSVNFTPTGSTFSTAAYLALFVPYMVKVVLQGRGPLKVLSLVGLTLFGAVIVLVGPFAVQIAALLATVLTLLISPQQQITKALPLLLLPIVVSAAVWGVSNYQLTAKNALFTRAQNFPQELQLPLATSWKITISAFRDAPLLGTGPATYLFDFTSYKPVEFNNSRAWNIRFDQSFNEYLQVWATLGLAGLVAFLLLTAMFVTAAVRKLLSDQDMLSQSLGVAGLTFFLILVLHPSSLVLWVIGIILLACFMVANKDLVDEMNLSMATVVSSKTQRRFDILPTIVLAVVLLAVVVATAFTGKFALADYYHRQALNAVATNQALNAYNSLVKAENLNPYVDLYRSNLAKTNFALANAIAAAHGPTQDQPEGSLSDQDKQNIQTLLSQAITEGKVAAYLSPNNPNNWETLGVIYRQISGVAQNAQNFALDAYGRAIQRDPYNPLLRLSVGGIYYSIKNYDLAIRFYTDSVQLKPDFANGWYNLAIAFREKGDNTSAIAAAEKAASLVDPKSQDYQVATQFLSELRAKASGQAPTGQTAPAAGTSLNPASQTNSALQKDTLPQVLDLPKSENTATPPAVKK